MSPVATVTAEPVALAGRLRPVLLHVNRHLRREASALGISAGQASILAAVRDKPGVGVAEVAARERTSVPSVCVHVDKLEAAGLVTRNREISADRRRVGLVITPDGERLLRSIRSRRTAWLASRLAALTPQQQASIAAAVDGLAALVEPGSA